MVVDSNGDGVADKKAYGFNYGIIPNDRDGSIWTGQLGADPQGSILRYDPATNKFEQYIPPPGAGYPRGVDSDSKGIIWAGMGSGHLASFDRSKCRQTWGDGTQCAEGWTYYKSPGPYFRTPGGAVNADFHYYVWVDKYNTLGLGKDTPILNGTASDSLLAFNQKTKKFTIIRIPYPLNAYQRGLDGGSTTRRPAGRAAASGSTSASTPSSTRRSSTATWRRCSSGRTRWPGRTRAPAPLPVRGAGRLALRVRPVAR